MQSGTAVHVATPPTVNTASLHQHIHTKPFGCTLNTPSSILVHVNLFAWNIQMCFLPRLPVTCFAQTSIKDEQNHQLFFLQITL